MTDTEPTQDAMEQPTLETERLVLRPITDDDAEPIARLAGDRRIAAMTLTIPHPYEEAQARDFIAKQRQAFAAGTSVTFAVTRNGDDALVGMAGLVIQAEHKRAELGYWIGVPYWGHGFATEAARAVMDLGFRELGCYRVYAQAYRGNTASRRVLEKIGMDYEGCQPGHIVRLGERKDVEAFGLLRSDWLKSQDR